MNIEQSAKYVTAGKHAVDTTIGIGGVSAFAWWPYLQGGLAVFMAIGGALLLTLRIMISVREYRALHRAEIDK